MNNLYQPVAVQDVIARIGRLQPSSQRLWGKMNVSQMLAHCSSAMEMASGKFVAKRTFLGRIVGPRVRYLLMEDRPFSRNNPTAKELKVADAREFAREQERLVRCVREFHQGGESGCTTHPHPFFGSLTPLEWSTGMYKHLDHHLTQFGA
jgi:Protein of unknown function (DUF1569)